MVLSQGQTGLKSRVGVVLSQGQTGLKSRVGGGVKSSADWA